MKRFWKKILLFVLPIIVLFGIGEWTLRNAPNSYEYKSNYMNGHTGEIKILILGSSHGLFNIDPKYLKDKAFNLANVSQTINYDYLLFNKFAPKMDSLKYIILPVSYFSLREDLDDSAEDWRTAYYTTFYHILPQKIDFKNFVLFSTLNYETIERIINSLLDNNDKPTLNIYGFDTSYIISKRNINWQYTGKIVVKRNTLSISKNNLKNKNYIREMAETCNKNNISLILLTTPTWKTYRKYIDKKQMDEVRNYCELLSQEYTNVTYLNLFNDARFKNNDFFDTDHLSTKGAKKLTQILDMKL